MQTECSAKPSEFTAVEGRAVIAEFDGGAVTSDAGGLLLGAADKAIALVRRLAGCFRDARDPRFIEHVVATLVGQRVFGIALGYEDLNDHDDLRHDPMMAVLAGKLEAWRSDCAPVAGKSTLNRLELSRETATRYCKIAHDPAAIEHLLVDVFLEAHEEAPKQIILDLDATDDPLHGEQEGRFFHAYYDCYCYLPLYVFCGRHLLAAKLRPSNIDGSAGATEEIARIVKQIRSRWPRVRILLRGDSGFAREGLMSWCETNRVDYLLGLARNYLLVGEIVAELAQVEAEARQTGKPARRFKDFSYSTLDSCAPPARGRQGGMDNGEANPRFVVTTLKTIEQPARELYEVYCARRHGEPHQGISGRPVRRPDLGGDHARQSTAPLVLLDGLCARLRGAPHRAGAHAIRRRHLRQDPAEAVQNRRARESERAADQVRASLRLPLRRRMAPGRRLPHSRRSCFRLTRRRHAPPTRQLIPGPPETRDNPIWQRERRPGSARPYEPGSQYSVEPDKTITAV